METAVLTCPKCSSKEVIKRGLIQSVIIHTRGIKHNE